MARRLLIASLGCGAILAVLVAGTDALDEPPLRQHGVEKPLRTHPPPPVAVAPKSAATADPLNEADTEALARALKKTSLFGTEPDGELAVDENGDLVVVESLRWLFDYFLSLTGEVPFDVINRFVEHYLRGRLPIKAAGQALALWQRYVTYRDASRELYRNEEMGQRSFAEQISAMATRRENMFGSDHAAALFGEEQQTQRLDLARYQSLADKELSPAEQGARLAALEEMLPPSVRAARAHSRAHLDLRQAEADLLATAGHNPQALHALRRERVGAEAADRLEALDRARQAWQQRLSSYRQALKDLETNGETDAEDRSALLAEHFAPHEQIRVRALERKQPR